MNLPLTMEKQLNWVPKLSLEEIALRRVMINLWNETVILAFKKNISLRSARYFSEKALSINNEYYISDVNQTVEDMVKNAVLKQPLPKMLKDKIMLLVKPIGLEILKWQICHDKFLISLCKDSYIRIFKHLCWTSTGVIDYQKTAKEFISLDVLDGVKHYRLACLYCLVDYIPFLWKLLPEETKIHFYEDLKISIWGEAQLESYWAYVLKGDESKLDSIVSKRFGAGSTFHQYAFEGSARTGNKIATEYFFARLTNRERNSSLFRTIYFIMVVLIPNSRRTQNYFPRERLSDIICYFLSTMTFEEQMKVLMEHPCEILGCFLDWPWQDLFLDVADIIWTFIPESKYAKVLYKIMEGIQQPDYYFPDLIQKFFQRSPCSFKKYLINSECNLSILFYAFCSAEDTETIEIVFRIADAKDRMRLISSYSFYELFDDLIIRNQSHMVELFLQETILSKEDKERIKEAFTKFVEISEANRMWDRRYRLKLLFKSLDKVEANTLNKRNLEETKPNMKKLCCETNKDELP